MFRWGCVNTEKVLCYLLLLYLPTQIRSPIRGERVSCHGPKLTNSLGWTKPTNSLSRETTTWTFDSHVIRSQALKRRQICVPVGLMSKGHWSWTTFLTREGIHYSRKGIYHSAKTCLIDKGEKLNILCLQTFNLAPKNGSPVFGSSLFNRCRQVGK